MNILMPMAGLGSRFSNVGIQEPKHPYIVTGKQIGRAHV